MAMYMWIKTKYISYQYENGSAIVNCVWLFVTYGLPGSSVQGILQIRILEWVAVPSSRGSSLPRNQTHVSRVSCISGRFFNHGGTYKTIIALLNLSMPWKLLHMAEVKSYQQGLLK